MDVHRSRSFTLRAIVAGLVIGILGNLSNTYYGLQAGSSSQEPTLSALLGFILFKFMGWNLTASESVLIASVATATGCMPVTGGFTGVIPAIEYILGPEDGGQLRISSLRLIIWSIGVCGFGLLFASLLWDHFIVKEDLPWPGPKATAAMINTLYGRPGTVPPGLDFEARDQLTVENTGERNGIPTETPPEPEVQAKTSSLLQAGIGSGLLTILMYFIPVSRALPLFGRKAAKDYLWTVNISPGFFGQGIITGPIIPLHMFVGAVVGWAVLAPLARRRGWAPGDIDDWETGGRGWTIWVSVTGLMADASVKLTWFIVRPLWSTMPKLVRHIRSTTDKVTTGSHLDPLLGDTADTDNEFAAAMRMSKGTRAAALGLPMKPRSMIIGFLLTTLLCIATVQISFGGVIPWYHVFLGVLLALPMAVVGIRSLAEADYNPESALFSQLVFATIIPPSDPNAMIINILSAGLAQAGASQAGDIAYDFKIGHLVGAPAGAQLYGQIIGSIFGAFLSCLTYRLYTSQYPVPGPLFQVPASFLDVTIAKLVMGRGLPEGVANYVTGFGVFFVVTTIIKMRFSDRWWQHLIPSGVSFAIGMYNIPSFTIARVLGGLFYWAYTRRKPERRDNLIVLASGLVVGESLASLVDLALAAFDVPQLKFGR